MLIILATAVMAVTIGAIAAWKGNISRLNASLSAVVAPFGGMVHSEGSMRHPSASFTYNGAAVMVRFLRERGRSFTEVCILWPDREFTCKLWQATFVGWLNTGFPRPDFGTTEFRRHFGLRTRHHGTAARVISGAVQSQLEQLRHLAPEARISLAFADGWLVVRKSQVIKSQSTLQQFVMLSLQLYDQATLACSSDFEILAESEPSQADATCKVCGEEIRSGAVICRTCRTPHHRECWSYFGACSTYGCGERKFRRVKT